MNAPITNIAPALARAQKQIAVADRNAINTDHESRYADLSSIILACREALAEQEISILQPLGGSATELLINTLLVHSSGEVIETEFRVRPENPNDTDAVSSLVTKYRRYGLQSLLCIASKDDDGITANGAKSKPANHEQSAGRAKRTPAPTQDPGPVVESHNATEETKPAPEPEKVSSSEHADWMDVVCHAGAEGGPVHGKKLGELDSELRHWLAAKIAPTLGKSKKDRALAAAIAESIKDESTPATAPEPLPEDKNAPQTDSDAKKGHSSEESKPSAPDKEPEMEWRSIACHSFRASPTTTLGELIDSENGKYLPEWDGIKIIRWLRDEGIKKIQAKSQSTKDKILVNAILAANSELDTREKVIALFEEAGMDAEAAEAHLKEGGIFDDETLANAPRRLLDYIVEKWSDIKATIK